MGRMKEQLIDIEEMLANGATCQEVSDFTGLPVSEVIRIEAYALGDVDLSFNDEDYENHRRFGMPLEDVLAVEKQLEDHPPGYDFAELYEGHRRFQMIVDSLQNPPSFTGVENS